jgi:hypothetical protein
MGVTPAEARTGVRISKVEAVVIVGWAVVIRAGIAAVSFVSYLVCLGFVIVRTGGTAGLPDVAKAIRAYRIPLPGRNRK